MKKKLGPRTPTPLPLEGPPASQLISNKLLTGNVGSDKVIVTSNHNLNLM